MIYSYTATKMYAIYIENTVKPMLVVTSIKQPPALNKHAFKFPSDYMPQKLTCIKQSPALNGQFWFFP